MQQTPILQFERVSKSFGATVAVDDVSIDIAEGEFFALLGPSGCGKTTLMRMAAGFENLMRGACLSAARTPQTFRRIAAPST